jgi:glycosyltransferase involved in cell wall biosynthesis
LKLSVIIPCFNEARYIVQALDAVRQVDIEKEIIVVDDASTDRSRELLEQQKKLHPLVTCYKPVREGKGAAIRSGLELVTGDVVIIQDADLEYDPQQFHELIGPIVRGEAQAVYGSRFRGTITGMRPANRLGNHLLTWAANLLYAARITDEATCYKAFRTDLIRSLPLRCRGFEFCPEVTARVRKRGVRIHEVPIRYAGRTSGEGKKIRWTDGLSALWTLVKYRFRD